MEAEDYARWLKSTSLTRFIDFCRGLNRTNGRSWPPHATTFARKSAWLLPVAKSLIEEASPDKAKELLGILENHALRNI